MNKRGEITYKDQFTKWIPKLLVTGGPMNAFNQTREEKQAKSVANQSIKKSLEQ
jgi:hypothetical protein